MNEKCGKSKVIIKYLGYLIERYCMMYTVQLFSEYRGFAGPIYTYSFYNENGCFTIHHIVQSGDMDWYISKSFSTDQYALIQTEIPMIQYFNKRTYSIRSSLREVACVIEQQIQNNGSFFGIAVRVADYKTGDGLREP